MRSTSRGAQPPREPAARLSGVAIGVLVHNVILHHIYRLQLCHMCEYGSWDSSHVYATTKNVARTVSSRVLQLFHPSQIMKAEVKSRKPNIL